VFPGGSRFPKDPERQIRSLKTAWNNVREKAGVTGRWHDNRRTLITELAENGAGDETIMEIAGHVSRQMLLAVRAYSHGAEAKRAGRGGVEAGRGAAHFMKPLRPLPTELNSSFSSSSSASNLRNLGLSATCVSGRSSRF